MPESHDRKDFDGFVASYEGCPAEDSIAGKIQGHPSMAAAMRAHPEMAHMMAARGHHGG